MEEQGKSWTNEFKVLRKLGNGSQGQVFQIQVLSNQEHYAMKIIKANKQFEQRDKKRIEFQIQSNLYLSNSLCCDNFPKLQKYWIDQQSIYILFELCDQNSETGFRKLNNYSQRYNYLIVLLFDGLKALEVLERSDIIHRDIKPENILKKGDTFKMGDLGLSRIYSKGSTQTNNVGNKLGRSPEFSTGFYTTKSDVWSLGIHIFYLLENILPFDEKSLMMIRNNLNEIDKIIASKNLEIDFQPGGRKSKNVLSFLHMILMEMIVVNPQNRQSASKLLQQNFPQNAALTDSNLIRWCLFGYLRQRDAFGQQYLIILCAHIDFYRLDSKIRQETQSNKRKICLKVKKTIVQLLAYIKNDIFQKSSFKNMLENMIFSWEKQLIQAGCEMIEEINDVQSALEIYKISKVQEKFPLIEWMIKLYKVIALQRRGVKCKKIALWDIPIDFYKIL